MNSTLDLPTSTSQSPGQLFKTLQQEYYSAWFRFHPEESVDVGVSSHADELKSYSDDDIGALKALNQKLLSALEEINSDEMEDDDRIDHLILKKAAEIELHDLEDRDWRFRDPLSFVPVNSIYQLLIQPVEGVHGAIKHRLMLFPEYLRGARVFLSQAAEQVVPNWLEAAIDQCHVGSGFMRSLGRHPLMTQKFTNPARLQSLYDDAAHALDGFATFLEKEVLTKAAGSISCGERHYNRLLNDKHFYDTSAKQVLALGERLYDKTRQALLEQTRLMQGDDDVVALQSKIFAQHPDSEQLLNTYRVRMKEAFEWWSKSNVITVPDKQALKVQETPEFMRHLIPFAAYKPPSPVDREHHGLYYVSMVKDQASMAQHNRYSIDLTCAHEAFPGHHLQFVTEHQQRPANYTRLLNASASMYEGWALYAEDLAVEQGWLNNDEHKFIMLRDRLWRTLRIIIDVKLQTGQLTQQQAVELIVKELGFSKSQARGEVNWYSRSPSTPMCYAVGRELILASRDLLLKDQGSSLKDFHQKLLSQGSIALPLVIQQSFGEQLWSCVHDSVFAEN